MNVSEGVQKLYVVPIGIQEAKLARAAINRCCLGPLGVNRSVARSRPVAQGFSLLDRLPAPEVPQSFSTRSPRAATRRPDAAEMMLVLELGLCCGLRISEILRLKVGSVALTSSGKYQLEFVGKGNVPRDSAAAETGPAGVGSRAGPPRRGSWPRQGCAAVSLAAAPGSAAFARVCALATEADIRAHGETDQQARHDREPSACGAVAPSLSALAAPHASAYCDFGRTTLKPRPETAATQLDRRDQPIRRCSR